MKHTPIPREELDVFSKLDDIQVVIDVGARTDTAYFAIHPEAEYHLFEPNPEFFKDLEEAVENRPRTYLHNYGLGDTAGEFFYNDGVQGFVGGEAPVETGERLLRVETLDSYVQKTGIQRIDFLKVDVEGFDFKVLLGAKKALKITRFLQYEHWDDTQQFHDLLEKNFVMEYIGYRNVLCMNKKLVSKEFIRNMQGYLGVMGYRRLT